MKKNSISFSFSFEKRRDFRELPVISGFFFDQFLFWGVIIYLYVFRLDLHTHKLEDLKNKIHFFLSFKNKKKTGPRHPARKRGVQKNNYFFLFCGEKPHYKTFFFFFLLFSYCCCCHFGVFFLSFFIDFTLDRRFFAKRFFVLLFQILFYLFLGK